MCLYVQFGAEKCILAHFNFLLILRFCLLCNILRFFSSDKETEVTESPKKTVLLLCSVLK
jgi:hypothetical protein